MVWTWQPPAFIDDQLGPDFETDWHREMHVQTVTNRDLALKALRTLAHQHYHLDDLPYVDPTESDLGAPAATVSVPWGGFPRILTLPDVERPRMWEMASTVAPDDSPIVSVDPDPKVNAPLEVPARVYQDEYLEWHDTKVADPDDANAISRVTFTCESPEYWMAIARANPKRLHELYEKWLGHPVPRDDLFFDGSRPLYVPDPYSRTPKLIDHSTGYNPNNRWNTSDGAMHLTQRSNTLGAEVNLAAIAALPRTNYPDPLADPAGLCNCARFGNPCRNSDPQIGARACRAVLDGNVATLTNPIGLYMSSLGSANITLPPHAERKGTVTFPSGPEDPAKWWVVDRPAPTHAAVNGESRILRAHFAPPEGALYTHDGLVRPLRVTDLLSNLTLITAGGALAEGVTMHLYVTAWAATKPPFTLACTSEKDVDCVGLANALRTRGDARSAVAAFAPARDGARPGGAYRSRW